jgi:predicted DNA-binding protein
MSRVLSLSLTDELYGRVSEMAASLGMTVYQYVRKAIETAAYEDECMALLDPDKYELKTEENDD